MIARFGSVALALSLLLAAPAHAEVPIDPGQTATIRLSRQGELAYPVPPKPPHAPANHGAILSVEVDEPGLYHVVLSAPGSIAMFRDGRPLVPVADHVGGAGSGVARTADFDLGIGRYTLALSGMVAGEASVTISR